MRRPPRSGSTRRFPEPNGVRLGHRGGGRVQVAGSVAPSSFSELAGRPVAAWSVEAARSVADGVVLVVPAGRGRSRTPVSRRPPAACGCRPGGAGGATRAASVRAGLAAVPDDAAIIVVHDAARPLATGALFASVVAALRDPRGRRGHSRAAGGRHPEAGGRRTGSRTVWTARAWWPCRPPRRSWPPRCGPPTRRVARPPTTPAWWRRWGLRCATVEGDPHNVKLTRPEDLALAEALLP